MKSRAPEAVISVTTADEVTEWEAHVQSRLGGQIRDFRLVVMKEGVILRGPLESLLTDSRLPRRSLRRLTPIPESGGPAHGDRVRS